MLGDLGRRHEFRYVSTGVKTYPVLAEVREACTMLLDAIRPICEATVQRPIPDRE